MSAFFKARQRPPADSLPAQRPPSAGQVIGLTAAFLVLCAAALWLRAPVADVEYFQNEDVAGITYNADLLLSGYVPLKDNLEYKAPGSFFLSAAVFSVFGRSIKVHEYFGVFWSLLATLGMLVGGRLMFGAAGGIVAAAIFVIFSPTTDSMTVNYNAWMITPYVWSTVFLLAGFKSGRLRWLVLAGAVAVFSALLKRQGAMIVPLFGLLVLLRPLLETPPNWTPPRMWSGVFAFSAGVVLGFLPISVYYLANDGFGAFASHYFGSGAGWEYVQGTEVGWDGKWLRLEDGVLGLFKFMALPTILSAMTLAALPLSPHRGWGIVGALLGGHLVVSSVGVALGFRFYMGYYLQLLPAMAWLVGHNEGPLLRWFLQGWPATIGRRLGRCAQFAAVLLLCLPVTLPLIDTIKAQRKRRPRATAYQREAVKIAAIIKRNTLPYERIWVWGRWAWPIYFHADRLSVTRYYKVLGLVTTNLTNTWRRPTSMTRFVKKGPWREIGRHLVERKPPFIVAANNESYRGFTPLEKLLREHYEQVRDPKLRLTAFHFYVLKGRPMVEDPPKKPSRAVASRTGMPGLMHMRRRHETPGEALGAAVVAVAIGPLSAGAHAAVAMAAIAPLQEQRRPRTR